MFVTLSESNQVENRFVQQWHQLGILLQVTFQAFFKENLVFCYAFKRKFDQFLKK